jgi:CRISPR system Cascade subunit CasC
MLIELHLIQNHAPSNLNRDDTGSPKEAFFGGHRRARISSQCLKRSIRKSLLFREAIGDESAFRTKRLFDRVERALNELDLSPDQSAKLARVVGVLGSGKKQDREAEDAAKAAASAQDAATSTAKPQRKPKKEPKGGEPDGAVVETKQLIFFGNDEVRAIAKALKDLAGPKLDGLDAMPASELEQAIAKKLHPKDRAKPVIPVEIALFGRMTTSDAFEDVAASVQVAHAVSTNKLDHEFDYYTAVDDLKDAAAGDDAGAGMMGDVEFNSSCYYKYFSIGWDSLLQKIGDPEVARAAVAAFIRAAALATPSGKQNSFAAHNPPDFVMVECKPKKIPLSYANAFVDPIVPRGKSDLVSESISKFTSYVEAVGKVYAIDSERFWVATRPLNGTSDSIGTKVETLDALIDAVTERCKENGGNE